MTDSLRVALVQMNSGSDIAANVGAAEGFIRDAAARGAQLIALPENAFLMRDPASDAPAAFPAESHPGLALCTALAAEYGVWILAGSVFTPAGEKWHNESRLFGPDGRLAASYDKIHLFDVDLPDGEHYRESDRIAPGDRVATADLPWGVLGMSVCYDLRFPQLYRELARRGARLLAVPAAFAHTTGKAHWHVLLRARAIETGSFVLAPAQCGDHPGGRRNYGHSLVVGPWGGILAEADETTPGVLLCDLAMGDVDTARMALPCLSHDREFH